MESATLSASCSHHRHHLQYNAPLVRLACRRFETTAHSIAWALYEIAADPAVQAQVAAELAAAGLLGPGARQLEHADLAGLTYLSMVLKESMRLHPVASTGTIRWAALGVALCDFGCQKQGDCVAPTQLPLPTAFRPVQGSCKHQEFHVSSTLLLTPHAASGLQEGPHGHQPGRLPPASWHHPVGAPHHHAHLQAQLGAGRGFLA